MALSLLSMANARGAEPDVQSLFGTSGAAPHDLRFRVGFVHQHEDFFDRAFSYQGLECGVSIDRLFIVGVSAAGFASTLQTTIAGERSYVSMRKAGLFLGGTRSPSDLLHTGWAVSASYFALDADHGDFLALAPPSTAMSLRGLVLEPEVFVELNVARWVAVRAGLAYSFYSFSDQSLVRKSDLDGPSLVFAADLGRFH